MRAGWVPTSGDLLVTTIPEDDAANELAENMDFPTWGEENGDCS